MSAIYSGEEGYISLLSDVLALGVDIPDRTGVGTKALFDGKLLFEPGVEFPFSTVRPMPLRLAFHEFWFFLNGETQTKKLEEKGVNFWRGNTSKEFLESRELGHLPEGDMGKAYGFQWRNFGGELYNYSDGSRILEGGVDQLEEIFEALCNNPYSRRFYTTFWNPLQSSDMALTPCWHSHQFVVLPNRHTGKDVLHLKLINRSLDTLFGAMFAVQQYALYQTAMAQLLGMEVGTLSCDLTHIHLYDNQLAYTEELLTRDLGTPGTVKINKELNGLWDLLTLTWDDIEEVGLEVNRTPFVTPRPDMAV